MLIVLNLESTQFREFVVVLSFDLGNGSEYKLRDGWTDFVLEKIMCESRLGVDSNPFGNNMSYPRTILVNILFPVFA